MANLAHPDVGGPDAGPLIDDLDRRLDELIAAEIGTDDVDLPPPSTRFRAPLRLWRWRARRDGVPVPG